MSVQLKAEPKGAGWIELVNSKYVGRGGLRRVDALHRHARPAHRYQPTHPTVVLPIGDLRPPATILFTAAYMYMRLYIFQITITDALLIYLIPHVFLCTNK